MPFERTGVASAARAIVYAAAAFVLATAFVGGPVEFLNKLDLKPGLFRDYHIYLAQSSAYLAGQGLADNFVYPPLLALLLVPVAHLPQAHADAVWWLVQLAVIACYARLLADVLRVHGRLRWPLALSLLVTSLPVLHGLRWGQISTGLVVLGALWLRAPARFTAFGLGVAAACKVFPIAFVLPAWPWRRVCFALQAVAWCVVLGVALPIAVLGLGPTSQAFERVAHGARVVVAQGGVPASQNLGSALRQWFSGGGRVGVYVHTGPWLLALPSVVQRALFYVIGLVALAATWHAARISRVGSQAVAAMTMLVVPLLLPLAWEHYFCALPLAVAAVLGERASGSRALGLALLAWALPALGLWAQLFDDWNVFTYASAHVTTVAALAGVAAAYCVARAASAPNTSVSVTSM